jgi:uncharacterized membrane protein YjjB (DUF3815 family)
MRLPDVDLVAGVSTATVAILALTLIPELETVIAPAHTLGAFASAALGRWYARARKAQAAAEPELEPELEGELEE